MDLVWHVRAVLPGDWAVWSRWPRRSASPSCSAASVSCWWPDGVETWRWLFIVTGILAVAAGIMAFAWPDITLYVVSILVAWYLIVFGIVHLVSALAGAQGAMVVDPAAAGDRRALPGGVGHPLLGSGRC
jgi:hypothetical protein